MIPCCFIDMQLEVTKYWLGSTFLLCSSFIWNGRARAAKSEGLQAGDLGRLRSRTRWKSMPGSWESSVQLSGMKLCDLPWKVCLWGIPKASATCSWSVCELLNNVFKTNIHLHTNLIFHQLYIEPNKSSLLIMCIVIIIFIIYIYIYISHMIYHCVTKLGKYVSHGLQRITTFICSYYYYIVIISVGKMFSLVYREVSINGGVTMIFSLIIL